MEALWWKKGDVPVYASGINPTNPTIIASKAIELGYSGLKLKIGLGQKKTVKTCRTGDKLVENEARLMADANQAFAVWMRPFP